MKIKRVLSLVVLMLAVAAVAHADSLTLATGLTADANLTTNGSNFTIVLTFTNTTGSNATVDNWSLQLFNPGTIAGGSFTSPLPSGWSDVLNSNGSNGTNDCKSGQQSGWLCASDGGVIGNAAVISAGGSLTFTFSGTVTGTTPLGTLDMQASGCPVAGTCGSNDNHGQWAVSQPMTTASVPEPASMLLLGSGLSALGLFGRRKFRK